MTIAHTWDELVTVGLLGTDRRDPPDLAPGALADVLADALDPTPQSRLLTAVAATAVVRRCGAVPAAPLVTLAPPAPDGRPMLPPAAGRRWRQIVSAWPMLEREWLQVATAAGWRPSPDVLVALLHRHRGQPEVGDDVMVFGGPVATWLVDHVPALAPVAGRRAGALERVFPVPPQLEQFVAGGGAALVQCTVAGLSDGTFRWSHRAVLHNVVVRMPSADLAALVAALTSARPDDVSTGAAPLGLWESMIELAGVRRAMLQELHPDGH